MAYELQITVDCGQPHALADWWAETLGWSVAAQDPEFIRKMISEGYATEADIATHDGALVFASGAAISHSDGRRIYFQRVPEPKSAKNRWHVDVRVGPENVASEKQRLIARGATYLYDGQQGPHTWVTMADPEGNEFCLC
jgi:Glyoxalase-like domain